MSDFCKYSGDEPNDPLAVRLNLDKICFTGKGANCPLGLQFSKSLKDLPDVVEEVESLIEDFQFNRQANKPKNYACLWKIISTFEVNLWAPRSLAITRFKKMEEDACSRTLNFAVYLGLICEEPADVAKSAWLATQSTKSEVLQGKLATAARFCHDHWSEIKTRASHDQRTSKLQKKGFISLEKEKPQEDSSKVKYDKIYKRFLLDSMQLVWLFEDEPIPVEKAQKIASTQLLRESSRLLNGLDSVVRSVYTVQALVLLDLGMAVTTVREILDFVSPAAGQLYGAKACEVVINSLARSTRRIRMERK